ncbi:hypothetical protein SK128_002332, partial [Halocaridina rubra]
AIPIKKCVHDKGLGAGNVACESCMKRRLLVNRGREREESREKPSGEEECDVIGNGVLVE